MSSSAIERLRERVEQRDAQDAETWSHVPAMFSLARAARLRRSPPTMARPRCSELPPLTARRRWSSPSSLPSGNCDQRGWSQSGDAIRREYVGLRTSKSMREYKHHRIDTEPDL